MGPYPSLSEIVRTCWKIVAVFIVPSLLLFLLILLFLLLLLLVLSASSQADRLLQIGPWRFSCPLSGAIPRGDNNAEAR